MNNDALNQFLYVGSFVVFLVLILLFATISAILNYHWVRYEISAENVKKIRLLYFGISLILILAMAVALIFVFY